MHSEVMAWVAGPAAGFPPPAGPSSTAAALPRSSRSTVTRRLCEAFMQERAAALVRKRQLREDVAGKPVTGPAVSFKAWTAGRAAWLGSKLLHLSRRCYLCRRRQTRPANNSPANNSPATRQCGAKNGVTKNPESSSSGGGGGGGGDVRRLELLQHSHLCARHSWAAGLPASSNEEAKAGGGGVSEEGGAVREEGVGDVRELGYTPELKHICNVTKPIHEANAPQEKGGWGHDLVGGAGGGGCSWSRLRQTDVVVRVVYGAGKAGWAWSKAFVSGVGGSK